MQEDVKAIVDELTTLMQDFPPVFERLLELCKRRLPVHRIRNDIFRESGINVTPPTVRAILKALDLGLEDADGILRAIRDGETEEEKEKDLLEDLLEEVTAINSLRDVVRDVKIINYIVTKGLSQLEGYDLFKPRDIIQAILVKDQIIKRAENTVLKRIAFLEEFMVQVFRILNTLLPEDLKSLVVAELKKEMEKMEQMKEGKKHD